MREELVWDEIDKLADSFTVVSRRIQNISNILGYVETGHEDIWLIKLTDLYFEIRQTIVEDYIADER